MTPILLSRRAFPLTLKIGSRRLVNGARLVYNQVALEVASKRSIVWRAEGEEALVRRIILGLVVAAVALALPMAAIGGGWAGSRYDKSECTYSKDTNSLYCESTFSVESFMTEDRATPDASCPSGTRVTRRTGWFVEVWRVFDGYTGHAPVRHHNVFGNESPLFDLWHWRSFTDTDLGCV